MSEVLTHRKPLKHELAKHIADVLISSPADGEVLTYESASAKWKNKPGGAGTIGKGFKAYLGANQTITGDGLLNVVNIDTEIFDDYAEFDTVNHTFTPQTTGKYFIAFAYQFSGVTSAYDGKLFRGWFYWLDGFIPRYHLGISLYPRLIATGSPQMTACCSTALVSGRVYYFGVDQNTTVNQTLFGGAEVRTWLTVFRLF